MIGYKPWLDGIKKNSCKKLCLAVHFDWQFKLFSAKMVPELLAAKDKRPNVTSLNAIGWDQSPCWVRVGLIKQN